jgi:hypothetical protein
MPHTPRSSFARAVSNSPPPIHPSIHLSITHPTRTLPWPKEPWSCYIASPHRRSRRRRPATVSVFWSTFGTSLQVRTAPPACQPSTIFLRCSVIIGKPTHSDLVLTPTPLYYTSKAWNHGSAAAISDRGFLVNLLSGCTYQYRQLAHQSPKSPSVLCAMADTHACCAWVLKLLALEVRVYMHMSNISNRLQCSSVHLLLTKPWPFGSSMLRGRGRACAPTLMTTLLHTFHTPPMEVAEYSSCPRTRMSAPLLLPCCLL